MAITLEVFNAAEILPSSQVVAASQMTEVHTARNSAVHTIGGEAQRSMGMV